MYFSLFKETKNFDFYCMFFSAVCVAQGYHITRLYAKLFDYFYAALARLAKVLHVFISPIFDKLPKFRLKILFIKRIFYFF